MTETYRTFTTEETEAKGAFLAEKLLEEQNGMNFFVLLTGDLGAGKTAFTRGFASVLSEGSRVKSPSFTIVNEYRRGRKPLFHFDLYRLGEGADLEDIGFDEYIHSGHVIIEWSEYLDWDIPENAVRVNIAKAEGDERVITFEFVD